MVYRIGKLKLKNRFLLAPMLEPNDVAFRLLCKKAGCGLTYCGMTSPLSRQKMFLDDKPAVQLFGNSAKGIASFIKKYDSKVSLWDFNLGCPSKLSKKMGHGAYLCIDAFAPKGVPPAQKASADADKVGIVIHCFCGKKSLIKRGVENGWFFSVAPAIKRWQNFQMMVEIVPIEQLLTETDSPFLSPVVGERNESANVAVTIGEIARIKGISEKEVADKIWENAGKLGLV